MKVLSPFEQARRFRIPGQAIKIIAKEAGVSPAHLYKILSGRLSFTEGVQAKLHAYSGGRIPKRLITDANRDEINRYLLNDVYMPQHSADLDADPAPTLDDLL